MARILKLSSIQVRTSSGDTPTFEPDQLRQVCTKVGETEDIFKIILDFTDEQGKCVELTIREIGNAWVLYGSDDSTPGDNPTAILPSMEDYAEMALGRPLRR